MPIFLFAVGGLAARTVYGRMFAPDFGIVEDPATGRASGPLGCYLVDHGLVAGRRALDAEPAGRGDGPRSRLHLDRRAPLGDHRRAVGGEAVLVGRGELLV